MSKRNKVIEKAVASGDMTRKKYLNLLDVIKHDK